MFESESLKHVEFVRGLDEDLVSRENLREQRVILFLDDVADEVDEKLISNLFTKLSHHRNLSVVFLVHNLFYRGLKCYRLLSLNTHYYILKKSVRDETSIATLARQIYGKNYKYVLEAYHDAVSSSPWGFLFVDLRVSTPSEMRLRSGIFSWDTHVVYKIKNAKI